LVAVFTFLALVLFLPSTPLKKSLPSFWADNVPKIVLGLDLQGGMHLVLEVDRDKAVENYTQRLVGSLEERLEEERVAFESAEREGMNSIRIAYSDEGDRGDIESLIQEEFPLFGVPSVVGNELIYTLQAEEVVRIKDWAVSQAIEAIRNKRVDTLGVREPLIQRQGTHQIVVQLPGLKDPARAIKLIGQTAILEFKLVDEEHDVSEALRGGAPFGSEVMYRLVTDRVTRRVIDREPYLIKKETFLTGDLLSDARVAFDSRFNEPYVALTFNSKGGRIFERLTELNVGKRLAIVLDGNVHSAPVIRERIGGGRASISGGFRLEEASDLATVLRSAFPAPVNIIQNVTVGPTLGKDSIEAGIKAVLIGGLVVLGFMLVYYKFSGVIANTAIMLNLLMLLGAMAWVNATLTLPGIAGIILTIGMGVDSNVLIFERIKEELRAGRTPRSAIDAGYERAWWTIIDSNITTLITALVLFQFGSGPVKGFAVALSLGILFNLFTSLVGTKLAFDIQTTKFRARRLSI
jgi:preprotein translocase subunit SecD